MTKFWQAGIDKIRRSLARSPKMVTLAIKVRNQCRLIIGYSMTFKAGHIDLNQNGEAWLARLIAPGASVCIDVGANVGEWAEVCLEAMPPSGQCLLIEPSETAVNALQQRFDNDPRVEILRAAVADASIPNEIEFYEEPNAGQTSSLVRDVSVSGAIPKRVSVTTIDQEAERHGWAHVDLLKIDVEGYDLHVLRGASQLLRQRRIGVVQFEYNSSWLQAGSTLWGAFQILASSGYLVFFLTQEGLHEFDYHRFGEFYSYSNFVAVSPECLHLVERHIRDAI